MIKSRLPSFQHILPVYGVIVLLLYGWTLYTFSWNLPAWILFRTMGDILTTLLYGMTVDFLESILFTTFLLLLAMLLPRSWVLDDFVFMGSVFSISILGGIIYLILGSKLYGPTTFYPLILLPIISAKLVGMRFLRVKKVVEAFADKTIIFVYFSLPISIASLIMVVIRNIF